MTLSSLFKDYPVFLAPMAGVTDAPFRHAVCKFGASAVVSEMVSSEALVRKSEKTYRRLVDSGLNYIKIVQIVGADPDKMAESALINQDLGADVVDINMGCPARKIVCNESGSALMRDENLAVKIAKQVVDAIKIPVTVKMRLGWDCHALNCYSLAKKMEDIGVQMISIHCRSRAQMYSGTADWDFLHELRDTIKIPYLCNGDITCGESAVDALRRSRANGVMIGRGALGKPWILRDILRLINNRDDSSTALTRHDLFGIIMEHFEETLNFYGTHHGIRIFRKHFCWYSAGIVGASKFREEINKLEQLSNIKKCAEDFFLDNSSHDLI